MGSANMVRATKKITWLFTGTKMAFNPSYFYDFGYKNWIKTKTQIGAVVIIIFLLIIAVAINISGLSSNSSSDWFGLSGRY